MPGGKSINLCLLLSKRNLSRASLSLEPLEVISYNELAGCVSQIKGLMFVLPTVSFLSMDCNMLKDSANNLMDRDTKGFPTTTGVTEVPLQSKTPKSHRPSTIELGHFLVLLTV